MEYTDRKQSEKFKEIGVDVMSSDLYISEDGKVFTQLNSYICPRCHGELIWGSDFMRSEIEGNDNVELDDDSLVTYYTCKDCNCMVEVVDAWPNEAKEGAAFRIAWSTDALIKLITDRDFDFMLTRVKNDEKVKWMIDVFYRKGESGGVFKKYGDTVVDTLFKAVVEIYENEYKK